MFNVATGGPIGCPALNLALRCGSSLGHAVARLALNIDERNLNGILAVLTEPILTEPTEPILA